MIDKFFTRVEDETTNISTAARENTLTEGQVQFAAEQVRSIILDTNYDTTSYTFDLIRYAEASGVNLREALTRYTVDSIDIFKRYNGGNCASTSLYLQRELASKGITSYVIPSFGGYLPTEEANNYVGVRTVEVIAPVVFNGIKTWLLLAPALTIDKPLFVETGYEVESFGKVHKIARVTEEEFDLDSIRPDGKTITRTFSAKAYNNPNLSYQQNLFRARVNFILTRFYEDETFDGINFDLPSRKFRVKLRENQKSQQYSPDEFVQFIRDNEQTVEGRFRRVGLVEDYTKFIDRIDEITHDLLLPNLRAIILKGLIE